MSGDNSKLCAVIKVGSRWIAGYVRFIRQDDGSPAIDGCSSPFNGNWFTRKTDAIKFIESHGHRAVRSYGNVLSEAQIAEIKGEAS